MGKIYTGKYTSSSNQVATFENGKIFSGKYTSSSNQVTIDGNKIYRGSTLVQATR